MILSRSRGEGVVDEEEEEDDDEFEVSGSSRDTAAIEAARAYPPQLDTEHTIRWSVGTTQAMTSPLGILLVATW